MNILGSINCFLFKPYAAIIIPFSNLIVSASTPTSLVLNSTIADSQTPSKNYTFVGQTGDTGTVGLTNSKYAMYLNTGTLSSTTLKWPGSSSGVTFMAWVQITSLQAYHSIVGFGVDSDGVGMSLLIHNGALVCNGNINGTSNETGMAALSTGQWYHICCSVIKSGNKRYFVNGVNVGGNISVNPINTASSSFIGLNMFVGWYSQLGWSASKIDDMYKNRVKVYTFPLTDQQIADIYIDELSS